MECTQLLHATEMILKLAQHDDLAQVVLYIAPETAAMTIDSFHLPWKIVRKGDTFTVVVKK